MLVSPLSCLVRTYFVECPETFGITTETTVINQNVNIQHQNSKLVIWLNCGVLGSESSFTWVDLLVDNVRKRRIELVQALDQVSNGSAIISLSNMSAGQYNIKVNINPDASVAVIPSESSFCTILAAEVRSF